uniref:Glutathione-dependent dehydroascorbate reductase n=1 Tax=Canis lupus familiaris TaxID=9615 RepID=A0A8I3S745_CANLF
GGTSTRPVPPASSRGRGGGGQGQGQGEACTCVEAGLGTTLLLRGVALRVSSRFCASGRGRLAASTVLLGTRRARQVGSRLRFPAAHLGHGGGASLPAESGKGSRGARGAGLQGPQLAAGLGLRSGEEGEEEAPREGRPLPDSPAKRRPELRAPSAPRRDVRRVSQEPGEGHEIININLKNKPEWFFKKNPFGLVPVLENSQGQLIYESPITCEYLDEAYPGKKLLPDDPYEKACQKMVFELFSKVPSLVTGFLRRQNKEDGSGLKEELRKEFSKLEEVLTNKKTTFFGGNSLSMIDYLIWPWFERLEALELNDCVDHTPKLKLWMAAMREDPAVSALLNEANTLRGFLNLYLQNSPEACDYGL